MPKKNSKKIKRSSRKLKRENQIDILLHICDDNYTDFMLKSINENKILDAGITPDNKFKELDTYCLDGYTALIHTQPPVAILQRPRDEIYFLPANESGIYNGLINACLGRNKYTIVFSVEGIYLLEFTDEIIQKIKTEFKKNKIIIEDEEPLKKCDFILKPKIKKERFYGFEPNYNFPILSELVANNFFTDIMLTADSFEDALDIYTKYLSKFNINVHFMKPTNMLRKK